MRVTTYSRLRPRVLAIIAFLAIAALMVPDVSAYTREFSEDFAATDYQDESITNATGWGTGEVKLPQKGLTQVCAADYTNLMAVEVEGNVAYIVYSVYESPTEWCHLQTLNISTIAEPEILGETQFAVLGPRICVEVDAGYAYLGDSDDVSIFNVSNPENPVYLASIDCPGSDVFVEGPDAFVGGNEYGLQIFNVTDPSSPVFVSSCTVSDHYAIYLRKSGDYVYVVGGPPDTRPRFVDIVNVTDINSPTPVCKLTSFGYTDAGPMDVEGNILAVFGSNSSGLGTGIALFDVSNVEEPKNTSFVPHVGGGWALEVEGNMLFSASTRMDAIDISDPYNPAIVSQYVLAAGYAHDMALYGECILTASYDHLTILRYCDAIDPVLVSDTLFYCNDLYTVGTTAYMAMEGYGLQTLDIADPANVTELGFEPLINIQSLCVSGGTAFVVELGGLQTFNVIDPSSIEFLGSYSGLVSAEGVFLVGDCAYVTDANGLSVLNVTDLRHPSLYGSYASPTAAHGVWSNGRYAYLAAGTAGLIVVNVTDPANPAWLYTADTPDHALAIEVAGSYAYVADNASGLQVFSLTDPTMPILVGSYDTEGTALDVCVSGNELYLADGTAGLVVLNITSPRDPEVTQTLWLAGVSVAVKTVLEYAYLGGDFGFDIIQVRRAGWNEYIPYAIAQSDPVFISGGLESIVRATLEVNDTVPAGSDIDYYLSSDNGTHWTQATPGVQVSIAFPYQELKWRAELSRSVANVTPVIFSLSITFSVRLYYPQPLSPSFNEALNDSTPTFSWDTSASPLTGFVLQVDSSSQFNSANLVNITITWDGWEDTYSHTLETPLANGDWYWRVAVVDDEGQLGEFSYAVPFSVETATTTTTTGLPVDPMTLVVLAAGGLVVVAVVVWALRKRQH